MGRVADLTLPTYDDIRRGGGDLVAPWVRRTPVLEVEVDGRPVDPQARAAAALRLVQGARRLHTTCCPRRSRRETLVAASGGNHGLAVAHVGHALGIADPHLRARDRAGGQGRRDRRAGCRGEPVGSTYAEALVGQPGGRRVSPVRWRCTPTTRSAPSPARRPSGVEIAEQLPDVDTVLVAVGRRRACLRGDARAGRGATGGAVVGRRARDLSDAAPRARGGRAGRRAGRGSRGRRARCLAARRDRLRHGRREHGTRSLLVSDDDDHRGAALAVARRAGGGRAGRRDRARRAAQRAPTCPRDDERVCVVVCGGNADPAGL